MCLQQSFVVPVGWTDRIMGNVCDFSACGHQGNVLRCLWDDQRGAKPFGTSEHTALTLG